MIPCSDLFRDALRYSRTVSATCLIVRDGVVVPQPVPITGGTVTCDTERVVRWTCSVTMALTPWSGIDVNTDDTRIRLFVGLLSAGIQEQLQVGEYQVTSIARAAAGLVTVTGEGLEAYVRDDRFEQARTPPYGTPTTTAISGLVNEAIPGGVSVLLQNTRNRVVTATAPWERERIDAVNDLSDSLQAATYIDHAGRLVIADLPDLGAGVPVAILSEGDGGLLVAQSEKQERSKVYNAVVASGTSTDPAVPPVSAVARNTNPFSPTRWGGPFGKVPRFVSSQFLTTVQQCLTAAERALAEGEARNHALSVEGVPLVYLTGGDLVWIRRFSGALEVHLLMSTQLDLGVTGSWSATTMGAPTYADAP